MLKNWSLTIIWALVILGLSIMPGISIPQTWADLFSWDKLAHAIVYGVLSYLAFRAYALDNQVIWKHGLWIIILTSAYGVLIEIIQGTFFPGRFFEVLDIIANIIGSLLGVLIFIFLQRRKKPRET